MRIGMVCPYSLDVPGGVQNHVKDLAEALVALGHVVSVLAPSSEPAEPADASTGVGIAPVPAYVVPAGRAVPVPYNGSVARVSFGPATAARARRWLREGDFDVVHVHEPAIPSVSLLVLMAADVPVVATFHTSQVRSRAMSASKAILRPWLEKVTARVAVSEHARDTLVHHVGGEPVIIPNGVFVDRYAAATPCAQWRGAEATIGFVGRLDEPRKGFGLLLDAFTTLAADRPGLRLLVVGGGDIERARKSLPERVRHQALFLGRASDADKATALRSCDVYAAPNTGGESFGIVLLEAMAAGAAVVASDLPAFVRVLDGGALGEVFPTGDATTLATAIERVLDDPDGRASVVAAGRIAVRRYDWSRVAAELERVYEAVVQP